MSTQLWQNTSQLMADTLKVDHSAVLLFDAEHKRATLAAEYPGLVTEPFRSVPLPDLAVILDHLKGKTSILVADVESYDSLGSLRDLFLDWKVRSTLLLPLTWRDQVIGLCSADAVGHARGFAFEEVQYGEAFAAQASLRIENLHLQAENKRDKARLERLKECAPSAIIEVDAKGNVTGCNEQARQILGYTGPHEMPSHVRDLYFYPTEAYEIGKRLHANGSLTNYETLARSNNGDPIPIRISVRHLLNEQNQRVWSVGNFEDLRLINEAERRLGKASEPLVDSKDMTTWFEQLCNKLLSIFPHTFCQIALFDDTQTFLTVKASGANMAQQMLFNWTPNTGSNINISRWLGLTAALHDGDPVHLHWSDHGSRKKLFSYSRQLGINPEIQSLLVVPLKIREEPLGLFNLGEMRLEHEVSFSRAEISRVAALAPQIASFIDRAILAQNKAKLLEHLNRSNTAAQRIAEVSAQGDLGATLQAVTRETCKALKSDAITLYVHDPCSKTICNPPQMYGVWKPERLKRENPLPKNSIVWRILDQQEPYIMRNINEDPLFKGSRFAEEEAIRSCVAVPLTMAEKPVGVMFINFRTLHQFFPDELTTITHFANQAAVAIHYAQLFEALRKTKEQLSLKTMITRMSIDVAESGHATLTDATTIRDLVILIDQGLYCEEPLELLKERLKRIDMVAMRIQENLKHAPLSPEEGQQWILVNDFVHSQLCHWNERVRLWNQMTIAVNFRQEIGLPDHCSVRGNPQWLTRAFNIIVSNALEAMTNVAQPTITVTTKFLDGGVGILISDTGHGIPDSILLYFLKRQIKKLNESKGSGMGVLLAQEIIETYGGSIRVGSTGPDGTTIIIWLPTELQLFERAHSRHEEILRTLPILLVGDPQDSEWISTIRKVLAPFGGIEVVREEELLWHLQKRKYQLVLLDEKSVRNPSLVTEQICTYEPGIRVVVAAESPKWEFARELFRSGAADCISRSVCPEELGSLLNRTLPQPFPHVELISRLSAHQNGYHSSAN